MVAGLSLTGCSGGGTAGTSAPRSCTQDGDFCIQSCNLGCTTSGCTITDIAQNQPLIWTFNQDVDPRSVDPSTISLKTLAGEEPVGTYVVDGRNVMFIPEVRTVRGATFFGFAANQEYVLTIHGGARAAGAVTSTSGDRLPKSFTCNLVVTLGIIDLNGVPPSATLLAPKLTSNVPQNTTIVVKFNELIDHGPFFNATGADSPIRIALRKTVVGPGGTPVCNTAGIAFPLEAPPRLEDDAVRGFTTATITPPVLLPGGSCVEVEITTRVRDLSGKAAEPTKFTFIVETKALVERRIDEEFQNDLKLDRERSSGEWGGAVAKFARLGGDGRHGDFDLADANDVINDDIHVFDTSNTRLAKKPTMLGDQPVVVDDGCYYFTKFVVPSNKTVRFVGPHPVRLFVRGLVDIQGRVEADGVHVRGDYRGKNGTWNGTSVTPGPGQPGSAGGAGGGRGGDGAWSYDESGNVSNPTYHAFAGFDGESVKVGGGHAYQANAAATAGRGSLLFPADGVVLYTQNSAKDYSGQVTSGGSGAGFVAGGTQGEIKTGGWTLFDSPNTDPALRGPLAPAGDPLVPAGKSFGDLPAGSVAAEYYLVGGGGGGGGGSHCLFARKTDLIRFWSGTGGAGGGGAIGMRVGGAFVLASTAAISCRGATGDNSGNNVLVSQLGAPAPGGSGSGGSIVLQLGGTHQVDGRLDVRGGVARPLFLTGFFRVDILAGAGSHGHVHTEAEAGTVGGAVLPATGAARSDAKLTDPDALAGAQSQWYATAELFPPTFVRYEVVASVNGIDETFSDDLSVGTPAVPGEPVEFWIQGAEVEPATQLPKPNSEIAPWRRYVVPPPGATGLGLNSDNQATGFRWAVLVDPNAKVVVKRVSVVWKS